jgi:hypothetical protein
MPKGVPPDVTQLQLATCLSASHQSKWNCGDPPDFQFEECQSRDGAFGSTSVAGLETAMPEAISVGCSRAVYMPFTLLSMYCDR